MAKKKGSKKGGKGAKAPTPVKGNPMGAVDKMISGPNAGFGQLLKGSGDLDQQAFRKGKKK